MFTVYGSLYRFKPRIIVMTFRKLICYNSAVIILGLNWKCFKHILKFFFFLQNIMMCWFKVPLLHYLRIVRHWKSEIVIYYLIGNASFSQLFFTYRKIFKSISIYLINKMNSILLFCDLISEYIVLHFWRRINPYQGVQPLISRLINIVNDNNDHLTSIISC